MRAFRCQGCDHAVFFENVQCVRCGRTLGYAIEAEAVTALEPEGDGLWRALAPPGWRYRLCAHYAGEAVCNGLVPDGDPDPFCEPCRLNQTIPDLSVPGNRERWARLERAKRRMLYGVRKLGLPVRGRDTDPAGLAFAFLADPEPAFRESRAVMTGHAGGLITINVAEADDAARERLRQDLNERYRTLLGHFRHEVGHHYWERLVHPGARLEDFRALFGDERADYDAALERHYAQGPPPDWSQRFVSAYAAAHPWEDWAETWAHYLHIVDTLETAQAFGLRWAEPGGPPPADEPYRPASFESMLERWLPLTYALNSINRSMGHGDFYPFVLSPPAVAKLRLVHEVVGEAAEEGGG